MSNLNNSNKIFNGLILSWLISSKILFSFFLKNKDFSHSFRDSINFSSKTKSLISAFYES